MLRRVLQLILTSTWPHEPGENSPPLKDADLGVIVLRRLGERPSRVLS